MSHRHKTEKDDCKPPRQKKCDRHHGHGHHGDKRKKCAPKHPWHHAGRHGGCHK